MSNNSNDSSPRRAPGVRTVHAPLGEITDSSSLFTVEKGATYKEFWTNVSNTWEGAAFAVAGTPFDVDPTPESFILSGEPEAALIVDRLALSKNSRVLEIGAGMGRIAHHLAPHAGHYTGADVSAHMLGFAKEQLASCATPHDLVELRDGEPIPLPDSSYDAVYAHQVFVHLDREDVFRYMCEAFRLLRPGGRVFFQFFNLLHPEAMRQFQWGCEAMVQGGSKVRGRVHFLTYPEVRAYVAGAGLVMDETQSHLEPTEQHYDFSVPLLNYDYYLLAVASKPLGQGEPAQLASEAERCRYRTPSDEYLNFYLDGFYKKAQRHPLSEQLEPMIRYLKSIETKTAYDAVLELERGVREAALRGIPFEGVIPLVFECATEGPDNELPTRVRNAVTRGLAQ